MDSLPSEFSLKCNVLKCSRKLIDEAWITSCGHIFCVDCGSVKLDQLPVLCPRCSTHFSSPFDVMISDLNPPSHFKKMVLMGLSPNECLSAAMNGIAFWTKQMSDTCSSYEMYAHSVHAQATATTSHYKMANNQLVEENASLKHQLQQMKEELEKERQKQEPFLAHFPAKQRFASSSPQNREREDEDPSDDGGLETSGKTEPERNASFHPEFTRPLPKNAGRQFMSKF